MGVGFSDLKLSLVFVSMERMDSVGFAICNGAFLLAKCLMLGLFECVFWKGDLLVLEDENGNGFWVESMKISSCCNTCINYRNNCILQRIV